MFVPESAAAADVERYNGSSADPVNGSEDPVNDLEAGSAPDHGWFSGFGSDATMSAVRRRLGLYDDGGSIAAAEHST